MLQAQLSHTTAPMQAEGVSIIEAQADLQRTSIRLMQSHYGNVQYVRTEFRRMRLLATSSPSMSSQQTGRSEPQQCLPAVAKGPHQLFLEDAGASCGCCELELL